jgi:hypothetical protein
VTADATVSASIARDIAARELVGTFRALLSFSTRAPDGGIRLDIGPATLADLVDTYNRATVGDRIDLNDVGR